MCTCVNCGTAVLESGVGRENGSDWRALMMRPTLIFMVLCFAALHGGVINAQGSYPRAGWQAELNMVAHGVSGTATIVDEDTFQVDNFTYDGGGLAGGVYFYLGASDSQSAFEAGLLAGPDLLGTSYDGTGGPLEINLPGATTLDGYNAVSVWCVDANFNFGSGTFVVPEPATFWLLTFGSVVLLTRRSRSPATRRRQWQ